MLGVAQGSLPESCRRARMFSEQRPRLEYHAHVVARFFLRIAYTNMDVPAALGLHSEVHSERRFAHSASQAVREGMRSESDELGTMQIR